MNTTEIGPYSLMASCECGEARQVLEVARRDGRITHVSVVPAICPVCGSADYEAFVAAETTSYGKVGRFLRLFGMEDLVALKRIEKTRRVYATFPERAPSP